MKKHPTFSNFPASINIKDFDDLYRKYYDYVYSYVFRLLRQKDMVDDLTQEVFIKVFRSLNSFEGKTENSFKSWLKRVSYNRIIDFYREQSRKETNEFYEDTHGSQDRLSSDNQDKLALIKQTISKIENTKIKETVELYFIQGEKSCDISRILNVPDGTIRWRISDFKARVVKIWKTTGGIKLLLLCLTANL